MILSESENEGSESDSVVEIRKDVLIQEVPKTGKPKVYGTKDIEKDFGEF